MQIEKVTVCKPIETLVKELKKNGFEIIEQKVSDYHFHQVSIKMSGNINLVKNISIDNIEKHDEHTYFCKCHWSTVEISPR
ncbi:hypothetical protein Q4603_21865 [Zobellia galactanivorans]|uniref:Uncharacterized protein n=1 Tax=Zobellia galactanivorans (strain DSM 12802 / CCUG 47099 / CIP 106680 / NCIMB 13871 / Dsij) TaxID=63186 RepID=G0L8F4_ZOBGA|nr:hypothetical protein [Zobellia galactanivorans]MBU3024762.1 hypothetical protein [Zobellia galactanivorans]MDO6811278.1 hypothetical protein [Zobellia galactanivorans]CAZ97521.1 Putative protein [Zobellia galactanivorans]